MDLYNLFRMENFDAIQIIGLVLRFIFNIGIASLIILFVYKRNNQNREFAFTLFSFNLIIFALCTILNNVELSIGSGFGLFAVFTMMRYRSEQLQIKDMTYLLIMVGLGFVNSTFEGSVGPVEIVFLNIAIFMSLYTLEKAIFNNNLIKQKIKYERLDLLKVGNKALLFRDLEDKIGAQVVDVKIDSVNYLDGSANILVQYNRDKIGFSQPWIVKKQSNKMEENKRSVELVS